MKEPSSKERSESAGKAPVKLASKKKPREVGQKGVMAKVRAAERERKRFAQDAKEMRQDARKISDGAQDFSRSIAAKRKEIHAGATTIVDQAKAIVEAGIGFQRDILRYCQEVGTFVNDFYFG